jgi:hypothetical protein
MATTSDRSRCPRSARSRILSTFSKLCRRHLGKAPPSGHPRSVDFLWRFSGGRLGKALSGVERVVREAAERGYRDLDLAVVANRLEA